MCVCVFTEKEREGDRERGSGIPPSWTISESKAVHSAIPGRVDRVFVSAPLWARRYGHGLPGPDDPVRTGCWRNGGPVAEGRPGRSGPGLDRDRADGRWPAWGEILSPGPGRVTSPGHCPDGVTRPESASPLKFCSVPPPGQVC